MTFEQRKGVDAQQVAFHSQSLGISAEAKVAFVTEALAAKKDQIRELAGQHQFCPDRACKALDSVSEIIAKLPEKQRESFVQSVATPLLANEPLDVLKFVLAHKGLDRLHGMVTKTGGSLITIMVEKGVDRLKRDIVEGKVQDLAKGEILPLSSRAIVYFLDSDAEQHREGIRERMKGVCQLISALQSKGVLSNELLTSTSSFGIDVRANGQSDYAGTVVLGYLQLVIEPRFSVADLATTLVHEDLHLLFQEKYGENSKQCVVDDPLLSKPLRGVVPFVNEDGRFPMELLNEFHSYTKDLDFKKSLVEHKLMPVKERFRFWAESRALIEDLDKANSILRRCEKRGEFTAAGSSLLKELENTLQTTKERIEFLNIQELSDVFSKKAIGQSKDE